MIISLYAGGMTIRDIQHHLVTTIGTDLSHETISNITDAVLEAIWSTLVGMQDNSSLFKGEGRRGMGLEAENPAGSLHQQPHPPPSLPLEGGGGGHSEVSA